LDVGVEAWGDVVPDWRNRGESGPLC
jgi:hypothetical protein